MYQVVDLEDSKEFQSQDVELLSISPDPISAWAKEGRKLGIESPLLSDNGNIVAEKYGVMEWAVGNEPGHTFVLVDKEGKVAWLRDYGAEENGGSMYVLPEAVAAAVDENLS